MEDLLHEFFPELDKLSLNTLVKDESSRILLYKEAAKVLMDRGITKHPREQLMLITSLSPFATTEEECVEVAGIIYWGICVTDIRPYISEHYGKEFAYRSLIVLSFFKKMMINKYERRAAPPVHYIRNRGISIFKDLGMNDIAEHFEQWEAFLNEHMVI